MSQPSHSSDERRVADERRSADSVPRGLRRPRPERTALLVVDVQEKLSAVMSEERMADLNRCAHILLGAARELPLRVIFTEHYPKGLGPTNAALRQDLEGLGALRVEKTSFSACGASGFGDALPPDLDAVIVIGMETHVCVFQTVRDLIERGFAVHVPIDGVVSRRDDHRQVGLDLCTRAGATLTTAETLVFDLLEHAGHPAFKALSRAMR
jgi:nicotinamidase-related amidase